MKVNAFSFGCVVVWDDGFFFVYSIFECTLQTLRINLTFIVIEEIKFVLFIKTRMPKSKGSCTYIYNFKNFKIFKILYLNIFKCHLQKSTNIENICKWLESNSCFFFIYPANLHNWLINSIGTPSPLQSLYLYKQFNCNNIAKSKLGHKRCRQRYVCIHVTLHRANK